MSLLLNSLGRLLLRNASHKPNLLPFATADSTFEATQREAAMFASDLLGAQIYLGQFNPLRPGRISRSLFADLVEAAEPCMVIDPRPGLHIIAVSARFEELTLTRRQDVVSAKLFDVFPDNPDQPDADGVSNLYQSIQRAAQSCQPHEMATQRYDVRAADGRFVERLWRPVNVPVLDETGRLALILHHSNPVGCRH